MPEDASPVVVAVVDTGVTTTHPELIGRIAPGGKSFGLGVQSIEDTNGHGTSVAMMIAANTNNLFGIAGVSGTNPVQALPLNVMDSSGSISVSSLIKAVDYAIEQQVDVINMSLGGYQRSKNEKAAYQRAMDAGIVVVAAAGNDGKQEYLYPASYEGVISVASINKNKERSPFSNYNDRVTLTAPGNSIALASDSGLCSTDSGTSFSAPMVSAAAASLKSVDPSLTAAEVREILKITAFDLGTPGRNDEFGYGKLQYFEALKELIPPRISSTKEWVWQNDVQAESIPINKTWHIQFTHPVDPDTLKHLLVAEDPQGYLTLHRIDITIDRDDPSLVLVNPEGKSVYQPERTYHLFITPEVSPLSEGLQPMTKTIHASFTTAAP